jgi:hypothetical protein
MRLTMRRRCTTPQPRAARGLAAFDKQLSAEYLESAKRAWVWAEAHSKENDAIYQKVFSFDKNLAKNLRNFRAMAAVELLAANHARDVLTRTFMTVPLLLYPAQANPRLCLRC